MDRSDVKEMQIVSLSAIAKYVDDNHKIKWFGT